MSMSDSEHWTTHSISDFVYLDTFLARFFEERERKRDGSIPIFLSLKDSFFLYVWKILFAARNWRGEGGHNVSYFLLHIVFPLHLISMSQPQEKTFFSPDDPCTFSNFLSHHLQTPFKQ